MSKVIILGDSYVGKTSILEKWTKDEFSGSSLPTVAAGMVKVNVDVGDGSPGTFVIWDTAGQERYSGTSQQYCRGVSAAMICFDLTQRDTFDNISKWVNLLSSNGCNKFILLGNKNDLDDERQVLENEAKSLAEMYKAPIYFTSAKTGVGIEDAFTNLVLLAKSTDTVSYESSVIELQKDQTTKKTTKNKRTNHCCK